MHLLLDGRSVTDSPCLLVVSFLCTSMPSSPCAFSCPLPLVHFNASFSDCGHFPALLCDASTVTNSPWLLVCPHRERLHALSCGGKSVPGCPWLLQEDEYGRARVHTQWGDDEADIEEAVQMCPVDCISYVGSPLTLPMP
jgi:hypothetical protein